MSDPPKKGDSPKPHANGALNGAANGAGHHEHDHMAEDELADADEAQGEEPREAQDEPLAPTPPAVAELVAACMRFVASTYKVALDGTPETLSLVDQYVREARKAYVERPESLEVVAPAIGAYLGEVMRQEFAAEWFAEGSHEAWRLYFHHVFLSFNPIGIAREAITMEEAGGWHAHLALDPAERELIDERLAAMPPVEEEEYYLPTTRFDVLTVVVETLRAHAEQSGTGDVRFTREDYD